MARQRRAIAAAATSEPETIAGAVGEVLSNVQSAGQDDGTDFDPVKLEAQQPSREPGEDEPQAKRPWQARFGHWRDNEAGVRIEEDRKNKLTSILFREPAPEKAQQVLLDHGYVREDDHVFSKPIDKLRQYEHREKADALVFEADNIVREGKGLPAKESYYISRS